MSKLAELIEREDIKMMCFHSGYKDNGPYQENEVFDVVLTRRGEMHYGGGFFTTPTLYVRNIGESIVNSMRNNGGELIEPELEETLSNLLSACLGIDSVEQTFTAWVRENRAYKTEYTIDEIEQLRADWEDDRRLNADMVRWLGDLYPEFIDGAQD